MKVVTVIGARPQFVKASSVSRALRAYGGGEAGIDEIIVHTGQHYDANMSDVFFDEMQIPKPTHSLGIGNASHGAMTGRMIEGIEAVLLEEAPDVLLIYGDTNSTLAGAIAASKLHIPVAHVEAGLRSFNRRMPEEINRVMADRISDFLFCPTQQAVDNLTREGVEHWGAQVTLCGDVMQDGAMFYRKLAQQPEQARLNRNFVLCTVHRAENTDSKERLASIFAALNTLAEDVQIVMPLHPRTKQALSREGVDASNVTFIDPVGYLNMVWLIDHCDAVLTDSGGLQKEAFFFGKPCVTLRDETEWTELVEHGFNQLAGADEQKILEVARDLSWCSTDFSKDLYGGGKASARIAATLLAV